MRSQCSALTALRENRGTGDRFVAPAIASSGSAATLELRAAALDGRALRALAELRTTGILLGG